VPHGEPVVGEGIEGVGDQIAGGHQRGQRTEPVLDRRDPAPLVGLVEHVVDDERHVVQQLDRERRLDRPGRRHRSHRAMTGEQRQGTEVLRRARQGPRERLAQLVVDALKPRREPLAQRLDVGRGAEPDDDVVPRDGAAAGHSLTR
jgi:hypothetical protein